MYALREILQNLFVRVAEQCSDSRVQRPVVQIVEVGEDRHLGELGDACQECETLLRLERLDDGVERLERVAELRDLGFHQMPEERLVVFVDEQHHLSVGRLRGKGVDEIGEKDRRYVACQFANSELDRTAAQMFAKQRPKLSDIRRLHRAHVEVQDRPLLGPIPLRLNGKPGEEVVFALEKRLQRRYGQRLAEPPRARDEELRADIPRRHRVEDVGLVDVCEAVSAEPLERVGVCRYLFHWRYYTTSPYEAQSQRQTPTLNSN